jgi:ribosomal protein S18 acetylase RimI-like enzyme
MNIRIEKGWDKTKSILVAELYDEAFGSKFFRAIPDKKKRIFILSESFIPEYSFAAISDETLVGLASFCVMSGSLSGGIKAKDLIKMLGFFQGIWACFVFSLFERKPKEHELIMDGIVVDSKFRGHGIGSLLLDKIIAYAKENDFDSVSLDVIDSNPRARKLYESKGFVAVQTDSFPYLKWLVGFSGATTMKLDIKKLPNRLSKRYV